MQLFTKEKKLKYEKGLGREKVHKNALVYTQSPWLQGGAYRPILRAVFSPLQIVSCLSLLILVGYIYICHIYICKSARFSSPPEMDYSAIYKKSVSYLEVFVCKYLD